MTFTFVPDLSIERDFVRFHSGDTISAESVLSDELIASLLTSAGSKQQAVIEAIQYKIALFSQPNFKADWLTIDNKSAVASLKDLLEQKRAQLSVSRYVATVTHVYRTDSAATSEPDYSEGRP